MDLIVNLHSFENITNHSIATTAGNVLQLKTEIYQSTITDTFHGQSIQLFGWKVVFRFPDITIDQFQKYTIYVSNKLGNADYAIQLKNKGDTYKLIRLNVFKCLLPKRKSLVKY